MLDDSVHEEALPDSPFKLLLAQTETDNLWYPIHLAEMMTVKQACVLRMGQK